MAEPQRWTLREVLEADLAALAASGFLPAKGERELRIRLKPDGRVAWFEAWRVRVPSSELDQDEDENVGAATR